MCRKEMPLERRERTARTMPMDTRGVPIIKVRRTMVLVAVRRHADPFASSRRLSHGVYASMVPRKSRARQDAAGLLRSH